MPAFMLNAQSFARNKLQTTTYHGTTTVYHGTRLRAAFHTTTYHHPMGVVSGMSGSGYENTATHRTLQKNADNDWSPKRPHKTANWSLTW